MAGELKIGIGIPHRGDVKIRTMASLVANVAGMGCNSTLLMTYGPFLHWNRELLFDTAQKQACSHLVFVDTDMVFPANAIRQLVDLGKDIVGIVAYKKILPKVACVRINEGVEIGPDEIPTELFRCAEVGTGLMAINVERAAQIGMPRFDSPPITPDASIPMGEDIFFCRKARAAGLEVWCDPTIEVKHIGDYEY